MPPKSNLKRQEKVNRLPDTAEISGLRRMVKKDAGLILPLLADYLK